MAQGLGLVGVHLLNAQVQVGVTAGVPLTSPILDAQDGNRYGFSHVDSAARRYTVGPSFEIHLAGPLSLETGFLYKRFGFSTESASGFLFGPTASIASSTTGNIFEFPFLAKTRVRLGPSTRLALTAGPVLRRIAGVHEFGTRTTINPFQQPASTVTEPIDTTSPASFDRRASIGGALGAGIELSAGPLRLTPGVRLTYWDTERTAGTPSGSRLNRTQLDALLNISYAQRDPAPSVLNAPSGSLSFGALAAVPLLSNTEVEYRVDGFPRFIDAPTRRFAAGAYLAFHFTPRFALEAGFLARRIGHTDTTVFPGVTSAQSIRGTLWEIPLLFQFRPTPTRSLTPVFSIGPALRRSSNVEWLTGSNGVYFPIRDSSVSRGAAGGGAAAGLEWARGRLRLRPELRFAFFERRPYDLGAVRASDHSLFFVLAIGYAQAK